MSLADRIPSDKRTLGRKEVFNALLFAVLAFVGVIVFLLLLQRLGLPIRYVIGIELSFALAVLLTLIWIGRTMTSDTFFFANRLMESAPLGIGGASDWVCGSFIVLFFTATLSIKMMLVPALMFGLLLQASLFSGALHRSRVLTVPGFVAWRFQSQSGGYAALLVAIVMLTLIIAAEWLIARDILVVIGQLEIQTAALVMTALVVLPGLAGGFLAVVLVNAVLVVWILISILTPAVLTGFFPGLLRAGLALDRDGQSIEALTLPHSPYLDVQHGFFSAPALLITILVFSAGFSVLPHAWSRSTLNGKSVAATESLGWSALVCFLIISALPLSIGLIGVSPSSAKLAILLESQPVLFLLPYLALFFAAFNVLSISILTLSASIVRALRRYRNLNPGEQSVFSTRLFVIAIAVALNTAPLTMLPDPGSLFLLAVSLGAAALFLPLLASIWFAGIPGIAVSLAIVTGAVVYGVCFYPTGLPWLAHPAIAGTTGMAASAVILLLGRLWRLAGSGVVADPHGELLRMPDKGE